MTQIAQIYLGGINNYIYLFTRMFILYPTLLWVSSPKQSCCFLCESRRAWIFLTGACCSNVLYFYFIWKQQNAFYLSSNWDIQCFIMRSVQVGFLHASHHGLKFSKHPFLNLFSFGNTWGVGIFSPCLFLFAGMFVGFVIFSPFHCVASGLVHLDVPKVLVVTRVELFYLKVHTLFSLSRFYFFYKKGKLSGIAS